jgi:hypothetical protein
LDGEIVQVDPAKLSDPEYCGNCYGAAQNEDDCCNTCEDVRAAYQSQGWALVDLSAVEQCVLSGEAFNELKKQLEEQEGCRFKAQIPISKLSGALHFAPSPGFAHAHDEEDHVVALSKGLFNPAHNIYRLAFGKNYPGIVNPLDKTNKGISGTPWGSDNAIVYNYYLKVVPTLYRYIKNDNTLATNQYSMTEHDQIITPDVDANSLPGLYINYDFSSIQIRLDESRSPLGHFFVEMAAIVGGVFAVSGIIDRLIFNLMGSPTSLGE